MGGFLCQPRAGNGSPTWPNWSVCTVSRNPSCKPFNSPHQGNSHIDGNRPMSPKTTLSRRVAYHISPDYYVTGCFVHLTTHRADSEQANRLNKSYSTLYTPAHVGLSALTLRPAACRRKAGPNIKAMAYELE